MKSIEEIKLLFEENYFKLDSQTIMEMNRKSPNGALNDVIVRLSKQCSGTFLEVPNGKKYNLFYINNSIELEGYLLQLTFDHPERDNLTFYFSDFLSYVYKDTDVLDSFNIFQAHTRSLMENEGYFTINPEEFKEQGIFESTIFAPHTKGIIRVPIFDKIYFYKSFFNLKTSQILEEGEKYIYVMLNRRNNLFKIGRSKNPFHREQTLQSQEPEVEIVALWCAPLKVETELHKQYKNKRKRGEWFKLSFNDLKQIKESMSIHE